MDGSTIFYIIAVIVYFIYSSFTKKKEEEARGEMEEPENMPKQGPSFEELLREIRKDQNPDIVEEVEEEWVEETRHRKYKEIEEQEVFAEEKRPVEKEFKSAYRDVRQPFVKLDDQVVIEDGKKILGEVVDVAGEYKTGNRYSKLLKNPESVKDAVILTEIFNRKHF
ncbi:hypothetical protein [Cyclobacterium amurskyense]|uniref:Uncharacterized protein n=1 Tax=Cyclobacterium amurskyense TaxID=320787 RepID=A0A0H4PHT1_9BACT|nr:hypothetical protein [Cyclobacterium amurskyense]AKP52585.1 hypothetical protein CA2015_3188 [Cyclobacterium amurskyense]|tara:strand:+ start:972 stop:1472 length:501 start_codon:yes stop_codon:yes gene_type:complete